MIEVMECFDETRVAAKPRTGGGDGRCLAPASLSCGEPDGPTLYEAERVRADTAEARMRELRGAEAAWTRFCRRGRTGVRGGWHGP